jgi:Fic family protein
LNELYLIISNNEDLINSDTNTKLTKNELFRTDKIFIGNIEVLISGTDVLKYTTLLIDYINEQKNNGDLEGAIIAHFLYEFIHPFPDFNGRIGRLLYR